jgi:hypothetical protein
MNNKIEDHKPGDPLLMMVLPGGGKMVVPDAESASELEETRKSIAKQKSATSLESPEPRPARATPVEPVKVKEPMVNKIDPNKIMAMLGGKGGGNGTIDAAEKRKIIQEIKSEMKPLIN